MAAAVSPLSGVCVSCRRILAKQLGMQWQPMRTVTNASTNILPSSDLQPPPVPSADELDPRTVSTPRGERQLMRSKIFPIGSRRRRAALQTSREVPFEQLPYQCFQEARNILQQDRAEKLQAISQERMRISNVVAQKTANEHDEWKKQNRLRSMRRHLEYLKIQADINDPLVKKRFEDGKGDMARPIYRHLAHRKWQAPGGKYLITQQRLHQMHVVPDLLPNITITADVSLSFHGTKPGRSIRMLPRTRAHHARVPVQPGEFVASLVTEHAPRIDVQVFEKGERLISIAIVDPDVPNLETDNFDSRCHFLALNIPISPTQTSVRLSSLSNDNQIILPWLPPYAQKGSPYHRLAVLVFQQPGMASRSSAGLSSTDKTRSADPTAPTPAKTPSSSAISTTPLTAIHTSTTIDVATASKKVQRDGFSVLGFSHRHGLQAIGGHLFRTEWDEWTDGVMQRLGVEGAGEELRRKKAEKLPYKKKDGKRYR